MLHEHVSIRLFLVDALLFVLVLVPVSAYAELPKPAPESGAGLLRSGSYKEAIEKFREEIQAAPENDELPRGLGHALATTGKYAEAIELLTGSKLFDKSSRLQSMAGRVHLRTGKLEAAEKALRKAIDLDSENVEAINRLGEVLQKMGQREKAVATWNRIIDVYQDMSVESAEALPAEGYVEMALSLIHLNRYEEANDVMFSQAEDQDGDNPTTFLEIGKAFHAKYDFPESRNAYRDAFKVNPRFPDARVALAVNYLTDFQVGTKRYDLAEKQIEVVLDVNPNHDGAYTARGSLWLSDGSLPRARKDFEKALEINSGNYRAWGLLAACLFLESDREGFEKVEAKVLAKNAKCAEFYHTIAEAIERRFRYLDAARMSEKALVLDPDYWPAYHTLGINLMRVGDEEKGRLYLDKSFKEDPFNVWVFNTRKLLKHMDKNHRTLKTGNFILKLPVADYEVLKTYLVPLLKESYASLEEHYKTKLEPPIFIEAFSGHQWFSTRIVGLAGFPASGACFGNLVALTTPKALPQNWGAVAWHEFAHVVTLHKTHHRVPRWLTEGLSVFEEGRDHPRWERRFERELGAAFASGQLLGLAELDFGFSKPKFPGQVLMSYYQGCMIVRYITKEWGFEKVLAVLEGYAANRTTANIFQEVFELSLDEFDKGFFAYLDGWVEKSGFAPSLGSNVIEGLQLELEDDPENLEKLVDLAWAYFCNDLDVDVPLTAGKALEVDPKSGDAAAILGLHDLKKGKTASARKRFEKALENGTRFRFRILRTQGSLALKEGDKEKAIELFEKAKAVSPLAGAGYPPGRNLYYQLAALYKELDKVDLGIERLEEVRSFSVEDPRCRMALAEHYIGKNTAEAAAKAVDVLDEVIYINPFDKGLHENLARAAVKAGRHEITVREYGLLLRGFPDTNPLSAHLAIARAHLALGDKAKAGEHARQVLDIDDENEDARGILEKAKE